MERLDMLERKYCSRNPKANFPSFKQFDKFPRGDTKFQSPFQFPLPDMSKQYLRSRPSSLYPNLYGTKGNFPFLNHPPPTGLFCEALNMEHMAATLKKDCVGVAQEKLNNMDYDDAWAYADKNYFIPMIDQRRAYYRDLEKEEKITSPLV